MAIGPEREPHILQQMEKGSSRPFQVFDFASRDEIQQLLFAFAQDPDKEFKSTGPVCSYYKGLASIDRRLTDLIGPHRILPMSNIFATSVPHGLHSDAAKDLAQAPYRAILIPLTFELGAPTRKIHPFDLSFFTFEQRWYGFPAKFFKGETAIASPHNEPVYDYENSSLKGLASRADGSPTVSEDLRSKYLSHLKSTWLDGLSVDQQFDWRVGSAIVFDSFQIHCSSDFRSLGVRFKIGLSIFTAKA